MRQRNRSLEVYKREVVSLSRRKGRKKRETPKIGVYLNTFCCNCFQKCKPLGILLQIKAVFYHWEVNPQYLVKIMSFS